MLLVIMTLPYLLLEDFCDKALSIGDMYVSGFSFPKIFTKGYTLLIEHTTKWYY
jgi:hypothetical protein